MIERVMTMRFVTRCTASVSDLLARFGRDARGISAVEFAMLLPLMVTLYLGTVEISQGVAIDRKVTLVSRTIADLTSRVSSVSTSDINDIFAAGNAVMAPYPTSKMTMKITCLNIDSTGKITVGWSKTSSGTGAHSSTETISLPTALKVASTSLIWSEVSYTYKPVVGYVITGQLNLSDQIYMRPRLSSTVTGP